ncbi:ABC transporter substrate-binding protein [Tistrella mobilis]|uniref:ABC transporter substrate-binding protein n=1 Tax=Tistrella mobilis TaxID=171437 RepID=UPI00355813AA
MTSRWRTAIAAAALMLFPAAGQAQVSDDVVRIAVMNDRSGAYADFGGEGSVAAARLAVEDFGPTVLGKPIEVISGDHQNKPDLGVSLARRWVDTEGVDMIIDFGNSAVSLAVQDLTAGRRVVMHVSSASDALFGPRCSPTGFLWNYDTTAIANAIGKASVEAGNDSWFFITADYAFGHAMEAQLARVITAAGGKVLGQVRHPVGNTDYSSFVLQAQASGAKIIALLNAGGDTTNTIKQAAEFGLVAGGQKLAGTTFYILNVHALGLEAAQGLQVVTPFYWDRNDASRDYTRRWRAAMKTDKAPTHNHAGVYSATLSYLKAIQAAGTDEAMAVSKKLKELPVDDFFGEGAHVRADGRMMKDLFLVQVKSPAESKAPWDYYTVLNRIPAEQVVRPMSEGGCPLVAGAS